MAEQQRTNSAWYNLASLWRPDTREGKEKPKYKLSGYMDAPQALAAAQHALAKGEDRVKILIFANDEKEEGTRQPDFRISAVVERADQGRAASGTDAGPDDEPEFQ